jgi:hypothetical protein
MCATVFCIYYVTISDCSCLCLLSSCCHARFWFMIYGFIALLFFSVRCVAALNVFIGEAASKQQASATAKTFKTQTTNKLHGLSPRANYTDRATAACRRSDCQLLRIEGATWSA